MAVVEAQPDTSVWGQAMEIAAALQGIVAAPMPIAAPGASPTLVPVADRRFPQMAVVAAQTDIPVRDPPLATAVAPPVIVAAPTYIAPPDVSPTSVPAVDHRFPQMAPVAAQTDIPVRDPLLATAVAPPVIVAAPTYIAPPDASPTLVPAVDHRFLQTAPVVAPTDTPVRDPAMATVAVLQDTAEAQVLIAEAVVKWNLELAPEASTAPIFWPMELNDGFPTSIVLIVDSIAKAIKPLLPGFITLHRTKGTRPFQSYRGRAVRM